MSITDAMRAHFPILSTEVNGRPLVYLDNAATMQMPDIVMEAMERFMRTSNANVHRGAHSLSEAATEAYEQARATVAAFLGCVPEETVLTSGTTDGLNKLAYMLLPRLHAGDRIIVTGMEHHANLLPWRRVAELSGAEIDIVPVRSDGSFDEQELVKRIDSRTKVVAVTQLSNVSGVEIPLNRIAEAVHHMGAILVVDGAQGIAHARNGALANGCDAYAFSGHKLGGPTGTGALYVRRPLLDGLDPVTFGGGAVSEVTDAGFTLHPDVSRFEPGTPHYQGAIGMAEAIRFWDSVGRGDCLDHEDALIARLENGIRSIEGVHMVAPDSAHHGAVSVWFDGCASFDACKMLDAQGIITRSGHHCAQPYLAAMGLDRKGALRFSVAPYNTCEEIDDALNALELVARITEKG